MASCSVKGGAGFSGSHIVEGLLRHGHCVRAVHDFATGAHANLEAVQKQLTAEGVAFSLHVVEGSVLDIQTLTAAMVGVDYVYHEAALPSVAFSVQDPLLSNRVNVE